jgi:hypothetical protein
MRYVVEQHDGVRERKPLSKVGPPPTKFDQPSDMRPKGSRWSLPWLKQIQSFICCTSLTKLKLVAWISAFSHGWARVNTTLLKVRACSAANLLRVKLEISYSKQSLRRQLKYGVL